MIINKGSETVTVKFNGQIRTLAPGEGLDIRDFDIENKHVAGAEKHIMSKYPGVFEQKETISGDPSVVKEYLRTIQELELKISALTNDLIETKASEKIMREKFQAGVGEIESAKQESASLRKEVDRLTAENENLDNEIKQLRLGSRTPKPQPL